MNNNPVKLLFKQMITQQIENFLLQISEEILC